MTMTNGERIYQLRALTDLWTGSVTFEEKNGQIKEKTGQDRLITTGLLGSIRWWFEVLVRGLGGSACDPIDTKCEGRNHCVVCELFGCTGWARKFRFEVLDSQGSIREAKDNGKTQITKDEEFSLRFTPLRPIRDEEWALLDATLRLIADYGAIGGKTVFKPSDEQGRENMLHHKDFGLVKLEKIIQHDKQLNKASLDEVEKYLSTWPWKINHGKFFWASLQHFWCVNGKYLKREDFNKVLKCEEAGTQGQKSAPCNKWLAGSQQESKKVFSFKNHARTFGFVKPGLIDFNIMKGRLENAWGKNGWEFLTKDNIIDQLFAGKEDRS